MTPLDVWNPSLGHQPTNVAHGHTKMAGKFDD
jgi:hypothetical protein